MIEISQFLNLIVSKAKYYLLKTLITKELLF